MKIAVVGTGYVGLVTGVCLSEIGHSVTCIDIDQEKVEKMRAGISPIYEPGLDELMKKNIDAGRLHFTTDHKAGFLHADAIYIAVGTPEREDGSCDLTYVSQVAMDIAKNIESDVIVVIKSTVPVGTNEKIKNLIKDNLVKDVKIEIVSNPEFLREGSAVYDTFHGDRIVIGSDSAEAADFIEEIYKPFGLPVFKTDLRSAEMVKYAANTFLAAKISFINEISNICERVGANIEDVAFGMGLDSRIGKQFLNAGIGYGGSCFPKDTKALVNIADNVGYDFEMLKSVIKVNKKQHLLVLDKLMGCMDSVKGKRIAVLGLSYKPNTDDMREAPSIVVTEKLIEMGAEVIAYDPIAMENAKKILNKNVKYAISPAEAVKNSDAALILTEWDEIKSINRNVFETMNYPLVIDGRNCFGLEEMKELDIDYYSVGRESIENHKEQKVKKMVTV
ncbi:UDP-glucose dehydrogenase family protein [Calidifontibacillus erzurumensis]|jgi:UDPglucose 6-dehydrogenase|uniref:UDP-glucose dehydrogenase family protein n=1 Tax=Calidifontibacillus erzurumensis TaxID=2741433 RepID=UPI0035B51E83